MVRLHYLWRAVDHEGEVLEVFVTKHRDRQAALAFLKRTMKRYGRPRAIVTDRLRSYGAAMNMIGIVRTGPCLSVAFPAMAGLSVPARLTLASELDRGQAERDPDPRSVVRDPRFVLG